MLAALTILPVSSAAVSEAQPELEGWERLLYYVDGKSLVKSEQFFLSDNGARNSAEELDATIELLNSQHGEVIACNFPSRYSWIKRQGYDVSSFDLTTCSELDKFTRSFQRGNISLVFASEHVDYPSSVFGHIFLLFHETSSNFLAADSIQFVAETNNEPLLEYIYRGISGGYKGYLLRRPFYVMRDNYSNLEQRALHIYKLDLSVERIEFLIYFLYELRKAEFDYHFAKVNCAYHIAFLLEVAYGATYSEYKHAMSVLPVDIINLFQKNIVDKFTVEPSLVRAQYLLSKMTQEESQEFRDVSKGKVAIVNSLSNNVKEVLLIENEYYFKRHGRVSKNYDEVMRLKLGQPRLPTEYDDDPFNNKTMFGLGLYSKEKVYGTLLQYRLIGRDIYELQSSRPRESKVVFMDAEVLIDNSSNIILRRLDIIGATSLFNRGALGSKLSWAMELGVNRENTLNEAAFDGSFSFGHSYANAHTGIGYLFGGGLQDNSSEGVAYIKPSVHWIYYPSKKIKVGWLGFIKAGAHGRYKEGSFFLTIGAGNKSMLAKYVMSNAKTENMLSLIIRYKF